MAIARIDTRLDAEPDQVWALLQRADTLTHIARPLVVFRPVDPPQLPEIWSAGEYIVSMWIFGVLPFGRQTVGIEFHDSHPEAPVGARLLRDNGSGQMIRLWDHWIFVSRHPEGGTAYTDRVEIRAGLLTPGVWLFASVFYRWRQTRWRAMLRRMKRQGRLSSA